MSENLDHDRASRIAQKAYERYVARGQAQGQDLEDWLVAEREVAIEDQDPDVAPDRLNERVTELASNSEAPESRDAGAAAASGSQKSTNQPRGGRR